MRSVAGTQEHYASTALRQTAALAQASAAWETFRRDAGPGAIGLGAIGPAYDDLVDVAEVTATSDPRRDGVVR